MELVMHFSALMKMRLFITYIAGKNPELQDRKVLDVGSWLPSRPEDLKENPTRKGDLRMLSEKLGLKYIGLDVAPGFNVDVVAKQPYLWKEIDDESVDFV